MFRNAEELNGKQAILSNGSPDMLLPLVEHSGLRFDAVISVDELNLQARPAGLRARGEA